MRRTLVILALAFSLHAAIAQAEHIRQPGLPQSTATIDHGHDLLELALRASGISGQAQLERHRARFERSVGRLQQQARHSRSPRDQAAGILHVLHSEHLTGTFDPRCGSLVETLDQGRFNCVTASLLYVALAERIGLSTTVLHASGHVRVRVNAENPFELEPTAADWFRRSDARLLAWQSPPRELSSVALVGKLHYNQAVQALERHDFAGAIKALERSLLCDPADADARHNLLAALNNGAIAACDAKRFSDARQLLKRARNIDPTYQTLAANELHLLGKWTVACCERHDFEQALALVDEVARKYPQSPLAQQGPATLYRLWGESLLARGERHAALARIESGLLFRPDDTGLLQMKAQLTRE